MKKLILRTCNKNLTSHNDFQWKFGENHAPDWDSEPKCGKGLHGLLWGEGRGNLLNYSPTSKWLVGEIDEYVDLDGKVKFPKCNVIFIGNQEQATQFLYKNSKDKAICGLIIHGNNITGGYGSRLTGGDYSILTGGYGSNLIGGYGSNLIGGYGSRLISGNHSTLTGGNFSTIKGGYGSIIVFDYSQNHVIARVGENGIKPYVTYICQNGLIVPKQT